MNSTRGAGPLRISGGVQTSLTGRFPCRISRVVNFLPDLCASSLAAAPRGGVLEELRSDERRRDLRGVDVLVTERGDIEVEPAPLS